MNEDEYEYQQQVQQMLAAQNQKVDYCNMMMGSDYMSYYNMGMAGQQTARRGLVMPSKTLLQGKPYTPSWMMTWKPTLIPRLNGAYGLQGKYRLRVPEGTVSYVESPFMSSMVSNRDVGNSC